MNISISLSQTVDTSYTVTIDTLPSLTYDTKVAIITNPKVAGLHMGYLLNHLKAKEVYIITVPDGEEYKNLHTIETVLDNCFEHRLDRKSLLIGFGGGVIGDMTGFAASLYQRGIDFVQIPTTLLSQVDASVGGKTAINNRFGKNLVGAFYQPKAVYIDTYFLRTLPKREYAAGIAEIIKMAVTFDAEFFEWLEANDLNDEKNIAYAIQKSVQIKADVVAQDEKEKGIRAALNYGHTFGHVIEHESGYGTFLHGEAVAMGMHMANTLAVRLNLLTQTQSNRIEAVLQKNGLQTHYRIKSSAHFYELFYRDKKSMNNAITFILPNGIGDVVFRSDIDQTEVMTVLSGFEVR